MERLLSIVFVILQNVCAWVFGISTFPFSIRMPSIIMQLR